jgi:hypothetical protein
MADGIKMRAKERVQREIWLFTALKHDRDHAVGDFANLAET